MDSLRRFLISSVLLSLSLFGSLHCRPEQNGSASEPTRINDAVMVTNATLQFVEKVFKRYSNGSRNIALNDFYHLLEALKIGQVYDVTSTGGLVTSGVSDLDKTKGEDGRMKREMSWPHGYNVQKLQTDKSHEQQFHNNCLGEETLLRLHHIDQTKGEINVDDFILLCPSLVYQVQSGACLHVQSIEKISTGNEATTLKVWLYGLVSITVISLSSLFAIAVIPCLGKAIYNKVMAFLVALAVGTLAGDAFLHLIPHAFLTGVVNDDDADKHVSPVWKGLVIMAGIYVFFMVESIMKARHASQERKHGAEHDHHSDQERCQSPIPCHDEIFESNKAVIVTHDHCLVSHCDGSSLDTSLASPGSAGTELSDLSNSAGRFEFSKGTKECVDFIEENAHVTGPLKAHLFCEDAQQETIDYSCGTCPDRSCDTCPDNTLPPGVQQISASDISSAEALSESQKIDGHHHHHGNKTIDDKTTIATVAWMVIVGDGFHNFSDGLAVGAAFSSSITNGLTTAIAVLCHELPHELGDFAVLLNSGISFRQALAYNMASAVISYIGLILGIVIGNLDTSHVWVMALTSGLFLYISLVSMLPELSNYQKSGDGCTVVISQNVGILTGVIIMLVIALVEKH